MPVHSGPDANQKLDRRLNALIQDHRTKGEWVDKPLPVQPTQAKASATSRHTAASPTRLVASPRSPALANGVPRRSVNGSLSGGDGPPKSTDFSHRLQKTLQAHPNPTSATPEQRLGRIVTEFVKAKQSTGEWGLKPMPGTVWEDELPASPKVNSARRAASPHRPLASSNGRVGGYGAPNGAGKTTAHTSHHPHANNHANHNHATNPLQQRQNPSSDFMRPKPTNRPPPQPSGPSPQEIELMKRQKEHEKQMALLQAKADAAKFQIQQLEERRKRDEEQAAAAAAAAAKQRQESMRTGKQSTAGAKQAEPEYDAQPTNPKPGAKGRGFHGHDRDHLTATDKRKPRPPERKRNSPRKGPEPYTVERDDNGNPLDPELAWEEQKQPATMDKSSTRTGAGGGDSEDELPSFGGGASAMSAVMDRMGSKKRPVDEVLEEQAHQTRTKKDIKDSKPAPKGATPSPAAKAGGATKSKLGQAPRGRRGMSLYGDPPDASGPETKTKANAIPKKAESKKAAPKAKVADTKPEPKKAAPKAAGKPGAKGSTTLMGATRARTTGSFYGSDQAAKHEEERKKQIAQQELAKQEPEDHSDVDDDDSVLNELRGIANAKSFTPSVDWEDWELTHDIDVLSYVSLDDDLPGSDGEDESKSGSRGHHGSHGHHGPGHHGHHGKGHHGKGHGHGGHLSAEHIIAPTRMVKRDKDDSDSDSSSGSASSAGSCYSARSAAEIALSAPNGFEILLTPDSQTQEAVEKDILGKPSLRNVKLFEERTTLPSRNVMGIKYY